MSDFIKHECGISVIRLLKPLEYYQEKYGSVFYGISKMYLMLEKQHNRGQDGAGFASIKLDVEPGNRYISRRRSNGTQPIQDIFARINSEINQVMADMPDLKDDVEAMKHNLPHIGELFLGHVRYGTYGRNSVENVHPVFRQNNWMHRNLIMAGNFNMTNTTDQFGDLIGYGMHPIEKADTITILEKIGHFLDDSVFKLYKKAKGKGMTKIEASPYIAKKLNIAKILRKSSKNWDGGYTMAGMLGHGDAFVLRDPSGIRPAWYYSNDEVVVAASERPAIQTVFDAPFEDVKEITPGSALIIKKNGKASLEQIIEPLPKKSCSFERIYFSRGSDAEIYRERKELGRLLLPKVMEFIDGDIRNTVFSYIPNTAETAFMGMVEAARTDLNQSKNDAILAGKGALSPKKLQEIQSRHIRMEKIAIKDAKLRTFITEDNSRDDLVAHVYDVTYGVVRPEDNLVILDDSIVRGTTLKKSILKMLSRLKPRQIVVVSSAPQIRYIDCYGIDMARLEDLVAFQAALALLKERGGETLVEKTYRKCKKSTELEDINEVENHVQDIYTPFTDQEISDKIAELVSEGGLGCEVRVIYQTVENLRKAIPDHTGDWYFTGDYPTPGGNRVSNRAFINFYEVNKERPY